METTTTQPNLKQLFEQFKFHLIYRNKQAKASTGISDDYKELLGAVREENRVKKSKIRKMNNVLRDENKKESRVTRPNTSLQTRIWKPKELDGDRLQQIKQNIIVMEQERQGLRSQINNLQNSLTRLKKNVTQVRKEVEIQTAKVQKYKHIEYLANSIQRNTQTVKIINSRSYKQLVHQQDQTLHNLKQFRINLKKDNDDLESKLMQSQVHKKYKRIEKNQKTQVAEVSTNIKIDKKFMNSLQELLQLFIQKESQFQEIKIQQTTKVRLKKINKLLLKQDRIKMHDMIEQFEDKYDVKVESLANLIVHIHSRLSQECSQMENQCIKMNQVKQLLNDDLAGLKCHCNWDGHQPLELPSEETHQEQVRRERIFRNSQSLVKVVMLFHNLIGKFRYLFTMAITLSKEKKNFHDLLVQIGHRYNPSHILLEERDQDPNFMNSITNFKEMDQLISQHQEEDTGALGREVLGFIFSDLRYTLIFRKSWLEEELREGMFRNTILQKVKSIHSRCDEIYDSKVKIYSLILINCLKSLSMNKFQKKIVAGSKANDSLFISAPKALKVVNIEDEDQGDMPSEKSFRPPKANKYCTQSSQGCKENFQLREDPRRIVQILQKLKNQQKKSFNPLQFNGEQVYLYDRKVVLPKYIYQ